MTTPHRPLFLLIAFVLACFALAACSPSAAAGGLTGGTIGLFLLGMLLAGSLTTQTGCDKRSGLGVHPCLSIVPPEYFDDQGNYVGPPERRHDMGQPPDQARAEDMDGAGDLEEETIRARPIMSPCLSIAPPASEPDQGSSLDEVFERSNQAPADDSPMEDERERLLAKLADRLPADVVNKLKS